MVLFLHHTYSLCRNRELGDSKLYINDVVLDQKKLITDTSQCKVSTPVVKNSLSSLYK